MTCFVDKTNVSLLLATSLMLLISSFFKMPSCLHNKWHKQCKKKSLLVKYAFHSTCPVWLGELFSSENLIPIWTKINSHLVGLIGVSNTQSLITELDNSTVGCTQPVGTDSFGGMSCLKFDKGLVDQSTNLSDITEKKIQTIFLTSI